MYNTCHKRADQRCFTTTLSYTWGCIHTYTVDTDYRRKAYSSVVRYKRYKMFFFRQPHRRSEKHTMCLTTYRTPAALLPGLVESYSRNDDGRHRDNMAAHPAGAIVRGCVGLCRGLRSLCNRLWLLGRWNRLRCSKRCRWCSNRCRRGHWKAAII